MPQKPKHPLPQSSRYVHVMCMCARINRDERLYIQLCMHMLRGRHISVCLMRGMEQTEKLRLQVVHRHPLACHAPITTPAAVCSQVSTTSSARSTSAAAAASVRARLLHVRCARVAATMQPQAQSTTASTLPLQTRICALAHRRACCHLNTYM